MATSLIFTTLLSHSKQFLQRQSGYHSFFDREYCSFMVLGLFIVLFYSPSSQVLVYDISRFQIFHSASDLRRKVHKCSVMNQVLAGLLTCLHHGRSRTTSTRTGGGSVTPTVGATGHSHHLTHLT